MYSFVKELITGVLWLCSSQWLLVGSFFMGKKKNSKRKKSVLFCTFLLFQPLFFLLSLSSNLNNSDILLYLPLLLAILIQTEHCLKWCFNMGILRHCSSSEAFFSFSFSISVCPSLEREIFIARYRRMYSLETLLGIPLFSFRWFYESLVLENKIFPLRQEGKKSKNVHCQVS